MVILQLAPHMTVSGAIRFIINCCLNACESGEFGTLAEDTARTCEKYLTANRWEESVKHRAKILQSLVLLGNLCSAVWCMICREKGGVFQPGDIYPK